METGVDLFELKPRVYVDQCGMRWQVRGMGFYIPVRHKWHGGYVIKRAGAALQMPAFSVLADEDGESLVTREYLSGESAAIAAQLHAVHCVVDRYGAGRWE